jgi:hypothetical protein
VLRALIAVAVVLGLAALVTGALRPLPAGDRPPAELDRPSRSRSESE